ncbi:chlorohydrolase [Streptococcus pneumoniae]|nr:chlorohydrolase [Streptococcus pneumoniae]
MKIKEQTKKLAAMDRTDEVSSKQCFEVADGS